MNEEIVYNIAHQLAEAIKESRVFNDYIKVQKLIEERPELKVRIRAFREKQTKTNNKQFAGEEIPADLIKEISLEFAKLNINKEAADFFQAEADFIKMFNEVQEIIRNEISAGFIEQ